MATGTIDPNDPNNPARRVRATGGMDTGRTATPFDRDAFAAYAAERGLPTGAYESDTNVHDLWGQAQQDFVNGVPANPPITGGTGALTGGTPTAGAAPAPAPAAPVANQWTDQSNALIQQLQATQQAQQTQNDQRGTALYDTLNQRATQGLNIDRNDPVIKAQTDAYAANQERARRDYLADVAEQAGPNANLRGEQRLAAERMGQQTGTFEAELIGRELQTRRDEIAQALQMQAGFLTADQQRALQMQLASLDAALQQQQLGQQESEFARRLGLDAETQAAYFDAVRRGLFRPE